ncbi:MAG: DUF429 domain-containing protein [Desulfurococcaceae archaeon]
MVTFCSGVDLAAKESKPSGVSVISVNEDGRMELVFVGRVRRDEEIIKLLVDYQVKAVALDSPLSLPTSGFYRELDLELKKRGFNVLPPAWEAMKKLTLRAVKLATLLRALRVEVLETHPSSCMKSSQCRSFDSLMKALGLTVPGTLGKDERDSVIAAVACVFYQLGKGFLISTSEGFIVLLPRICRE